MSTYRFELTVNNTTRVVYPKFSDSKLKKSREQGEQFRRHKWLTLQFIEDDFDFIIRNRISQQYQISYIEQKNGIDSFELKGKFTYSDCDINEEPDVKSMEVTPTTVDKYTKIQENLNVQRNIVEIVPRATNLLYDKSAILQIYSRGSNIVTNIIGDSYWNQETNINLDGLTDATQPSDYNFGEPIIKIFISGVGNGVSPDVTGEYLDVYLNNNRNVYQKGNYQIISYGLRYDAQEETVGSDLDLERGYYKITLSSGTLDDSDFDSVWSFPLSVGGSINLKYIGGDGSFHYFKGAFENPDIVTGGTITHVSGANNTGSKTFVLVNTSERAYRWTIYDTSISEYIYLAPVNTQLVELPVFSKGAVFTSISSGDQVKCLVNILHARILTNSSFVTVELTPGIPIPIPATLLPEDDFLPPNTNYLRAAPMPLHVSMFDVSDLHDTVDNGFGVFSEDALHFSSEYFVRPDTDQIPINLSEWTEQSLWFNPSDVTDSVFDNVEEIELRHAYNLRTVLKTMAQLADEDITSVESDFFFGLANSIRGSQRDVYLVPKSNILKSNYDQPASRAELSLSELFESIKNIYNSRYHIDGSVLHVEHLAYYENGKRYIGQNIGLDVTQIQNTRWNKALTNKQYKFKKEDLPERINFSWMDRVSDYFEGGGIIHIDEFVNKGDIKDKPVGKITSDLNYGLVNPSSISNDGFFIVETNFINGVNKVVYNGNIQNGYLAFGYLLNAYHLHGLSCSNVIVNGIEETALSVIRTRLQSIQVPDIQFIDDERLIVTSLGTGEVETITKDIEDYSNTIEVLHETES